MFKNIYFLNYKLLAKELSQYEVDDRLSVKYLIWQIILFSGSANLPVKIVDQNFYSIFIDFVFPVIIFIVFAAINIYGVWYLFQINNKGDGKDFLKRVVCLSFPVSIYLLLLFIVPIIIIIIWASSIAHQLLIVAESIIAVIMSVCFYWIMYKCFFYISIVTAEAQQKG